eukprot:SAG31_NODE_15690_length_743_cov_0.742236_2_plen_79_part_00
MLHCSAGAAGAGAADGGGQAARPRCAARAAAPTIFYASMNAYFFVPSTARSFGAQWLLHGLLLLLVLAALVGKQDNVT